MIVKMIKNSEKKWRKCKNQLTKTRRIKEETYRDNIIIQIENTLEGINSSSSEVEEWISELEDRMVEITSEEQNKVKRMKKTEDHFRDL